MKAGGQYLWVESDKNIIDLSINLFTISVSQFEAVGDPLSFF